MGNSAEFESGSPESEEFRASVSRLGEDVHQLKQDLAGLTRDAGHAAQTGVAAARHGLDNSLEAAREKGIQATESIRQQILRQPMVSVGLAAGLGFVLGMVCSRSR